MEIIASNINYYEARGIEQTYMLYYHTITNGQKQMYIHSMKMEKISKDEERLIERMPNQPIIFIRLLPPAPADKLSLKYVQPCVCGFCVR